MNKYVTLSLKSWHFEASEDIMTKFKSQGLHIIRIKYLNANGSGSTPSFIPDHWNTGILLHKQAKRRNIMRMTVKSFIRGENPPNSCPRSFVTHCLLGKVCKLEE